MPADDRASTKEFHLIENTEKKPKGVEPLFSRATATRPGAARMAILY
jgi:hypothetical protein